MHTLNPVCWCGCSLQVRASKEDYVVKKEEACCPSEAAALEETGGGATGARRRCVSAHACELQALPDHVHD